MKKYLLNILLVLVAHSVVGQVMNRSKPLNSDSELVAIKHKHAVAVEQNNHLAAGKYLQQMGKIYFNHGHYALALDFYQQAAKIFTTLNEPELIAETLSAIGGLYYYNKDMSAANTAFLEALTLYKQKGNIEGKAEVLGQLGHLYEKRQQYDSAFNFQKEALMLYARANKTDGVAKIYENIGSIYEDLAKYDSAAIYFNKSLVLYRSHNNEEASLEVINNLGDIERKTGRYPEALKLSKTAFYRAKKCKNLYQEASSAKDIALIYKLMGKLDSGFYYMELSRKLSLEIYSQEAYKQTSFLQVLYEMDQKSDEITRLENIRKVNYLIAGCSVLFVILVIVLAFLIIKRQRINIKNQKMLVKQKEAEHDLVQLDLKNKQLMEDSLKQELQLKMRELSNHTLSQVRTNQVLDELRIKLLEMIKDDKRDQKRQMQSLVSIINQSFTNEAGWQEFTKIFEQVHQSFFDKLKEASSDLTAADLRLIALLKMNLSSADISTLLGISPDSLRVSRYRLRKKLNISQGDNLSAFIQSL